MADKKYDLIVVGAGVLGTFQAYHALRRGLHVLHLEKDIYPVGSTVQNFGQVVPSGMADRWFDYGVRGLDIYSSVQEKYDISIRNNGSYYIASDADELQIIHELSDHYTKKGYAHTMYSKKQVLDKFPDLKAEYVQGAIVFEQELSAEPDKLITRLHSFMKQEFKNYELYYDHSVIACESTGDTVKVRTNQGTDFTAAKLIICNGYEFKSLFKKDFENSGIKISKLQMMRTVPLQNIKLPGNILTGLTIRRYESFEAYCSSFHTVEVPAHYRELREHGIHILFKQAVDGSIIVGDSHEYADVGKFADLGHTIKEHINTLMINEANRIMPLGASQIATSWAGFYSQHPDHIFEMDKESNIHIRTGIGGKGMTASAGYAEYCIDKLF